VGSDNIERTHDQAEVRLSIDTLIVWTEPGTQLDIALSFQDVEGCEDIWLFITEVQKHLKIIPGKLDHLVRLPA
jgi:hypothetical protein